MNNRVLNEIRHIPNVSNAQLYGDATREFQVETDPLRLMGVGATLPDVFSAIAQNNANLPGGRIDRPIGRDRRLDPRRRQLRGRHRRRPAAGARTVAVI